MIPQKSGRGNPMPVELHSGLLSDSDGDGPRHWEGRDAMEEEVPFDVSECSDSQHSGLAQDCGLDLQSRERSIPPDRFMVDALEVFGDVFEPDSHPLIYDDTMPVSSDASDFEREKSPRPPPVTVCDDDSDSSSGEDIDVLKDPAFRTREELFYGDVSDDKAAQADDTELPPAFSEDPAIRNIYISAFLQATFHGATHEAIKLFLDTNYETLASIQERTAVEIPGLDKMARTLPTVERHLGLDANTFLVYYFLCDTCWFRHHPSELDKLDGPGCIQPYCSGTLYEEKTLANGKVRRIPVKVLPTCPIEPILQCFLLRPGKYDEFQHWRKPGQWNVEDVDVKGIHQRFVSLPCGLVFMVNIDWFCPMKRNRKYSTGAVYLTICNNPRSKCFLPEETILLCVIPGPHEPSLTQLNYIIEPIVKQILKLYNGVYMRVHGKENLQEIHGTLYVDASDLPASRKIAGLLAPTAEKFMCHVCTQRFSSLVCSDCFDPEKFKLRDDWRFIKYAYQSRYADPDDQEEIAAKRGVRWSVLDKLPGWMPGRDSPVDFMHSIFLGEVKHVVHGILIKAGMFSERSRKDKPMERLEELLGRIWWPSTTSRIPTKISSTSKADEWRHLAAVLPVIVYYAWNINGKIPDIDAPHPKASTKAAEAQEHQEQLLHGRRRAHLAHQADATASDFEEIDDIFPDWNYCRHYKNILEFCASVRLWTAQSISPEEASRAEKCHGRAFRSWADMNCHLTPYCHLMMHGSPFIYRLGPAYAFWLFASERNNGQLVKVNHNGHGGGELESSLARSWVKRFLLHDLIRNLDALPKKSAVDISGTTRLKSYIFGNKKLTVDRKILFNQITRHRVPGAVGVLTKYPAENKLVNLNLIGHYHLVFEYLRDLWADEVKLVVETGDWMNGEPYVGHTVCSFSHCFVHGMRFGASTAHRGRGCSYAFIDKRVPVRIDYIFTTTHERQDNSQPPLRTSFAIVCRFITSDSIPDMPWYSRAIDLGISTWHGDQLSPPEVIDITRFSGKFALADLRVHNENLWIVISLDHVSHHNFICINYKN
ncbi:hypothetical protein BV25DRAFT_1915767 [Artomyces pyxidatus]|uniref:Uncharacterized protein n=1 Tax=Artomyces pyxidatus TaxID=48021 RepID=A0ACB8T304_9AGAM|nr:hypothetical protein BV25DRAFT_1915767 [Artomyces pyxidatus]